MRRPPQARHARGDAGKRICARRASKPHRRGRRILLVIGIENEDTIERAGKDRIDSIILAQHREAHVQEIRGIIELVLWINERLAKRIFLRHRGEGRHFAD